MAKLVQKTIDKETNEVVKVKVKRPRKTNIHKQKKKTKVSIPQFKKKVKVCGGSLGGLALLLDVSKVHLKTFLYKPGNEQYLAMFEEQKKYMELEAEDVIFDSIVNKRDPKTAAWYLARMSDKYSDKIMHTGNIEINISVIDPTEKKEQIE